MAELSRTNITNLAKSTFDKVKKITSSSDYLKNKKSRMAYCNGGSYGNMSRVRSYDEKNLLKNGKYLTNLDNYDIDPDHKFDLVVNLYTTLDLSGAYVITDINTNEPTCLDISLIPFYESYNIDLDSSLFGDANCTSLNYVSYMTTNLDYVPPPTVKYNLK